MRRHDDANAGPDAGPSAERVRPDCTSVREAISAEYDGESGPCTRGEVADHLAACAPCAGFSESITSLSRRTRVGTAEVVPDLSETITSQLADRPTPTRGRDRLPEVRVLVALAGAAQLVIALPMLLGLVGPDLHLGRDLGALQVALGVGLLFAAIQPRRAHGLLPVAVVVATVSVVAAGIDVATGVATLAAELTHLAEVIGVVALWVLAREVPVAAVPTLRPARAEGL